MSRDVEWVSEWVLFSVSAYTVYSLEIKFQSLSPMVFPSVAVLTFFHYTLTDSCPSAHLAFTDSIFVNSTFSPLPPLSPQVRWTKTAGSASDKFQETSIYNETLRIEGIQRVQGGRYYCKADNGVGVAAIKSIRVDVQCKWSGRKSKRKKKKKLLPLLNHS